MPPPASGPLEELFAAASTARKRAYAPYSRFAVGAAVRAASGRIYAGCNVENAAYPVGTCAEAGALSAMVVAGETRIVEGLVLADSPQPVTPCGACRQRLAEFAGAETPIHAAGPDGMRATFTLGALLPHGFGPGMLLPREAGEGDRAKHGGGGLAESAPSGSHPLATSPASRGRIVS